MVRAMRALWIAGALAGLGALGGCSTLGYYWQSASGHLALLDVVGLPQINHWYVTHLSSKKLSPAALAFKEFLIEQGGALMDAWS